MGLFDFLRRLFFPKIPSTSQSSDSIAVSAHAEASPLSLQVRKPRGKPRLVPLRRDREHFHQNGQAVAPIVSAEPPYRFANLGLSPGTFWNLSTDGNDMRLAEFGLPGFHTPEELADWLDLPLGKVAWLIDRFSPGYRPETEQRSHYHYRWLKKRTGGRRLIEAPKATLKAVQEQILSDILDQVPPHAAAHGFVAGRSIVSNASPHAGRSLLLKFDLENFYATVTFARVVAIFRSIGYSREAAIWLGRLTTSALPANMPFPQGDAWAVLPYLPRHLPQGAPTSPALANLSAYGLDVRLAGLARSFEVGYTRYADDLTFSGGTGLSRSLPVFIPLVTKIIREECFRVNIQKRKVLRGHQRQTVTGVVVNCRPNVSRESYDRLKAILCNCLRHGPASQNREQHPDFAAHLRGRIAHVMHLNEARGAKLLEMYRKIDWNC
jgi:RNA-directed DNA polymerase